MLPDRVSNPGPLTYESGALSIALRSPAPFQGGSFAVVAKCYMLLCPYGYGLEEYGHLNTAAHSASCFVWIFN